MLDVAFIIYDVASLIFGPGKERQNNWLALGADVVGAFIPFVTGGGAVIRAGAHVADHVDDAIGITHYADEVIGAACSFTSDTLVATPDGPVPISTIEVGDIVLAWDETTDEVVQRRVTAVLPHPDDEIARVTIDGAVVTTTPDHPFYSVDAGWVEAGQLQPGARVLSTTGSAVVASVEIKPFAGALWDLTVERVHTFFVGSSELLVHNCNFGTYIANGHAWEKHIIKRGEFPGVTTKEQFASLVDDIIHNSEKAGELKSGGWGYWKDGTMVIINPGNVDGGTAFRPVDGFAYFVGQLVNP